MAPEVGSSGDGRRNWLHSQFLEAVGRGDTDKVRGFLKNPDIDVNYAESGQGMTALHIAAARNAGAVLRLLIASGKCDVSARDHRGRTAATLAVVLGDNPVAGRYLFDRQHGEPPERTPTSSKGSSRREAEG
ncbi:ankyrin repeat domain-containing protein [Sinorhizobium medicae]